MLCYCLQKEVTLNIAIRLYNIIMPFVLNNKVELIHHYRHNNISRMYILYIINGNGLTYSY